MSYAGNTFKTVSQPVSLAASVPLLTLDYGSCCKADIGVAVSAAPNASFPNFPGLITVYSAVVALPAGIVLNPDDRCAFGHSDGSRHVRPSGQTGCDLARRHDTQHRDRHRVHRPRPGAPLCRQFVVRPTRHAPLNGCCREPTTASRATSIRIRWRPIPDRPTTATFRAFPCRRPGSTSIRAPARIYGTGLSASAPRYQYELLVVVTTLRNGKPYVSTKYIVVL